LDEGGKAEGEQCVCAIAGEEHPEMRKTAMMKGLAQVWRDVEEQGREDSATGMVAER
jgi:hypothetical protein